MEIRNEADLTQIIEEYYSCINMTRKLQLEGVLTEFKNNPQSIDLAKQMIVKESNSSMVKFYFLSVLECQELWSIAKFGDEQVNANKEYLWNILTGNMLSEGKYLYLTIAFLRNKIAQIVAEFANHQFPDQWPSYFGDVYNLHQQSLDLCLSMIESTAVEFFATKRNAPEQTLIYDQMVNLCQIVWRVTLTLTLGVYMGNPGDLG
jgi:Exportin 1-like protein